MALKRTAMITYNVHDRGRKARGVDRHFDCVALARLINGPAVQEQVKHGDMLGYFGHWPRVKFGMQTQEGGILDGKVISLPTAIRTVHLSADEQGNITHQAEFLDTNEGRLAASLYDSATGGFSSAMDAVPRTSPSIPSAFYGFDFVLEPNYTTNRGHKAVLDAVGGEAGAEEREAMFALLDAVASESSIALQMFDSLHAQHMRALETLERVTQENDLLIGMIAAGQTAPVLDGIVGEGGRIAPKRHNPAPDFDKYRSLPLAALQRIEEAAPDDNSAEAGVMRAYGLK
jgi:hypothetical protein